MDKTRFWLDGCYTSGMTKVTRPHRDDATNGLDLSIRIFPAGYWGDMRLRRDLWVSCRAGEEGLEITVRFGRTEVGAPVVWSTTVPYPATLSSDDGASEKGVE